MGNGCGISIIDKYNPYSKQNNLLKGTTFVGPAFLGGGAHSIVKINK